MTDIQTAIGKASQTSWDGWNDPDRARTIIGSAAFVGALTSLLMGVSVGLVPSPTLEGGLSAFAWAVAGILLPTAACASAGAVLAAYSV